MTKQWDGRDELRKLLKQQDELRLFYRDLGYDPTRDEHANKILVRLKDLLGSQDQSDLAGQISELVKELTSIFDDDAPYGKEAKERILGHINVFRSEVASSGAAALESLEDGLKHILYRESLDDCDLNSRRQQLDEHLLNLFIARYWFRHILYPSKRRWYKNNDGTMDDLRWFCSLRPLVLEEARRYLKNAWMQVPGINQVLLVVLLQAELIKLTGIWEREARTPWFTEIQKTFATGSVAGGLAFLELYIPAGFLGIAALLLFLKHVKNEKQWKACHVIEESIEDIGCGNFDSQELAGRLRKLEEKDLFINTLVISILKRPPS